MGASQSRLTLAPRRLAGATIALALISLVPAGALAATCASLTSFAWAGIGSGSWSCGAGVAGDVYVVRGGHTVTLTGSVTQSATPGAGIRVESGGTLVAAGPFVLTLGAAGLRCEAGSTCRLEGPGFRALASGAPALLGTLGPPAFATVASVVPCPDATGAPACATRPDRARILAAGASSAGIASIAAGDVLCFGDVDPDDAVGHPDAGACYAVTNDPGASAPFAIEFDVRQSPSARNAAGYPLALRQLREATVLDPGGAPVGARTVQVAAGTLSASRQWIGRWLRFADATGAPEALAYKLSETTDGGAGPDLLRIGDVAGFANPHPAGRRVFIDYGWALSDPFYVWQPLRVRSATAAETDSPVVFAGSYTVRRTIFDGIGAPSDLLAETGALAFEATSAPTAFEDVWLADPAAPASSIAVMFRGTPAFTIRRFQQTGGTSSSAGCVPYSAYCADYLHVFGFLGIVPSARFEDVVVRHHGDDVFLNVAASGMKLALRRVQASFVSRFAASGSLLDASGQSMELDAHDLVCDDCTSPPNGGSSAADVLGGHQNVGGSLSGLLVWGTGGGAACGGALACNDVTVIGSTGDTGAMVGGLTDHAVVREVRHGGGTLLAPSDHALQARRVWIRDSSFGNQQGINFPGAAAAPILLESTVLQDVNGPTTSFLLNGGTPTAPVVLRDVSAVWTGPHTVDRFLTSYGGNHELVTIDGVLVQGLDGPGEIGVALDLDEVEKPSPSCFFDVTAPWVATQTPFVPASWVASNVLGPNDPPRRPTYPWVTGLDCGATGPVGVPRERWMHGKAGIAPEHLGGADADEDDVTDDTDLCPTVVDPAQADADGDGIGDLCDAQCPGRPVTTITGVAPASQSGGQPVVVSGTGFGPNAQVFIGTVAAVTTPGAGTLTATVPALPLGSVQAVTVVNPEGCRSLETVTVTVTGGSWNCGLVGIEALAALALLRRLRRR